MNNRGRPIGFKPQKPRRPAPSMRDKNHEERRKAKSDKVGMLQDLIIMTKAQKRPDREYLKGLRLRHKQARLQLAAMRP